MSEEGFVPGVDSPIITERDCGGWSIGSGLCFAFFRGELIVKGLLTTVPLCNPKVQKEFLHSSNG